MIAEMVMFTIFLSTSLNNIERQIRRKWLEL